MDADLAADMNTLMEIEERPKGLLIDNMVDREEFETFIEKYADKDNYICSICFDILWQPVECASCIRLFCFSCIQICQKSNMPCPLCKKQLKTRNIDYKIEKNFENLKFFCPNKLNGCDKNISYESIQQHLQNQCDYQLISCEQSNCTFTGPYKSFQVHRKDCEFKRKICNYCDRKFLKKYLVAHQKQCGLKLITCQKCKAQIDQIQLKEHVLYLCDGQIIECSQCSTSIQKKKLSLHEGVDCLTQQVENLRKQNAGILKFLSEKFSTDDLQQLKGN